MKQNNILPLDTYYKIHFSDIRKTHSKTDIYRIFIFHYGVDFAANIAGSFINFEQNFIT